MDEIIRIMTCGDVDNGKSTILGHLLYDNNLIYEDQKAKIKDNQYAHILDGLSVEQEQNITVDVAYRYFNLDDKKFILADCPGHVQYTQNMATGASYSELAVVVIDITKGLTEQTKHHLDICAFLGITNFIFAINKVDLVNYNQDTFSELVDNIKKYCTDKKIDSSFYIPISGLYGDNLSYKSENTKWYTGKCLLDLLKSIKIGKKSLVNNQDVFLVQHIALENNKRYIEGYFSQGSLDIDDEIIILPSNQTAKILELYKNSYNNYSIILDRDVDVSRGTIIVSKETTIVKVANYNIADLIVFDNIISNKDYLFKNENNKVLCQIKNNSLIKNKINKDLEIELQNSIPLSEIWLDKDLGQFILIDIESHKVVAYGHIKNILDNKTNKKYTLWFTGLSGAGKTTLAKALQKNYPEYNFIILDGDELRESVNTNLGFSKQDRIENNRRIAELARLLNNQGFNVIVSCISPYKECRDIAKNIIDNSYKEIYLSTPLSICKNRDPKGLYKKLPKDFTGIDSDYEIPQNSNLVINTENQDINKCIKLIIDNIINNE